MTKIEIAPPPVASVWELPVIVLRAEVLPLAVAETVNALLSSTSLPVQPTAAGLSPDPPIGRVGLLKSGPRRVSGGLAARECCG